MCSVLVSVVFNHHPLPENVVHHVWRDKIGMNLVLFDALFKGVYNIVYVIHAIYVL